MRSILALFLAGLLIAAHVLSAADFEGKVTMKLSGAPELPPSLT